MIREKGPWPLIVAQNFKSPEEVIAVIGGAIPEGEAPTWDMVLSPKFRGYIARQGVCYYPELNVTIIPTSSISPVTIGAPNMPSRRRSCSISRGLPRQVGCIWTEQSSGE